LNVRKVAYTSEAASYAVSYRQAARRVRPVGGKNICTIVMWSPRTQLNHTFTFVSEPPGTKDVPSAHSEMVGARALKAEFDLGARIVWLYTERQPCGSAQGHANCTAKLQALLETYGAQGADTPVYYTFDYPTWADIESIVSSGLMSQEEAVEMAREACQCSTDFIINMDKTIETTVPTWGT
jgi:hypothetical protein